MLTVKTGSIVGIGGDGQKSANGLLEEVEFSDDVRKMSTVGIGYQRSLISI